jgi:hypothetical protein
MFRSPGAEAIAVQGIAAGYELEILMRDHDVQETVIEQTEQLQSSTGTGGSGISAGTEPRRNGIRLKLRSCGAHCGGAKL